MDVVASLSLFALRVRLLWPFRHGAGEAGGLGELAGDVETLRWREKPVWRRTSAVREMYRRELDSQVEGWLFSGGDGCAYLQVDPDRAGLWLPHGQKRAVFEMKGGGISLRADGNSGIELFLSPFGVGVLSIAVEVEAEAGGALAAERAVEAVHQLVQFDPKRGKAIYVERAGGGAAREDLVGAVASITDRLGAEGGRWTLPELADWLLSSAGKIDPPLADCQPLAYSVAVFGENISLETPAMRQAVGDLLSRLAQAEEGSHPGPLPGEDDLPGLILNRCHWAMVGLQGAAHAMIHQHPLEASGKPRDFDVERPTRLMDKYFLPYLVALLQRLSLHRLEHEAANLARNRESGPAKDAAPKLRRRLLALDASCPTTTVSGRTALHRYYTLCREGLGVAENFNLLRETIGQFDAIEAEAQRTALVQDRAASLHALVGMQRKIEWVEIFLISVYAIYAIHYTGEAFGFDHTYVGLSIVAGMAGAALLAIFWLRPFEHHQPPPEAPQPPSRDPAAARAKRAAVRRTILRTIFVTVMLGVYLLLGLTCFHPHHEPPAPGSTTRPAQPAEHPTGSGRLDAGHG